MSVPFPTPMCCSGSEVPIPVVSDGVATVLAALIAAVSLLVGYFVQQGIARRVVRATTYSEAIRAIEDYMEAPFLILRRDESTAVRVQITSHVSDVQSRLAYYKAELTLQSSAAIAEAYGVAVMAARSEAGPAMTEAWNTDPVSDGRGVPIGQRWSRAETDAALEALVGFMRADVGRAGGA